MNSDGSTTDLTPLPDAGAAARALQLREQHVARGNLLAHTRASRDRADKYGEVAARDARLRAEEREAMIHGGRRLQVSQAQLFKLDF